MFIPLETYEICEASPSDCVARQPINLAPYFAAFYCFLQNGPFPDFLPFRFHADCNPMLLFQWIQLPTSEFERSIAVSYSDLQ